MKKTFFLTALIFLCAAAMGFSQTAEEVSDILGSKSATYGQAAYIASVYSNFVDENASREDSVKALVEKGILKNEVADDEPISLQNACYIFARVTNMKGGLWYSIKPSPRYALKELKAKGIVAENYDPSRPINGQNLLDIFSNICSLAEAQN